MENCVGPSALPSRKPFKLPPCGGSAFLLEGASKFSKMSPPLLDFTTLNLKPVGGYQQVVHPYVNANWAVAFWLWVVDKSGDVDVELLCTPSINELCVSYRVLQQLTLVFTDGKLRLSPPLDGCDAYSPVVPSKREQTLIQIHGQSFELVHALFILLVRLGNSIPRPNCEVCWQAELYPDVLVCKMVQGNGIEAPSIPCYFADVVACISECYYSPIEFVKLLFGTIELADYCFGSLHRNSYMYLEYLKLPLSSPRFRMESPAGVRR